MRGSNGESRGYAFVNFTSETDYKDALTHMQGHRGLGSNPLRVSLAIPRNYNMIPGSGGSSSAGGMTAQMASSIVQAAATGQPLPVQQPVAAAYGGYVDPNAAYWQQQQYGGGWQGYGGYQQGGYGYDGQGGYPGQYPMGGGQMMPGHHQPEEDEFELIEHSTPIDVEKMNRELFERNQELWDALDDARWTPFNPEKALATCAKPATEETNGTAVTAWET